MAEARPGSPERNPKPVRQSQIDFIRHMSQSIAAMTQKEAEPTLSTELDSVIDHGPSDFNNFDHLVDDGIVRTKNGRNPVVSQMQNDCYPESNEQVDAFLTPEQLGVQSSLDELYIDSSNDNDNVSPHAFNSKSSPIEKGVKHGSLKSFGVDKARPPSPTPSAPEMRMAKSQINPGPYSSHTLEEAGQHLIEDKNELLTRLFRALSEDRMPEAKRKEPEVRDENSLLAKFNDHREAGLTQPQLTRIRNTESQEFNPNALTLPSIGVDKTSRSKIDLSTTHADAVSPNFSDQEQLRENVLSKVEKRTPTLSRHVRHPSGQSTKDLLDDFDKTLLGTTRKNLNDRFTEVKIESDRIPMSQTNFSMAKRHISRMPRENIESKSITDIVNERLPYNSRPRSPSQGSVSRNSSIDRASRNSSPGRIRPTLSLYNGQIATHLNRPANIENKLVANQSTDFAIRPMNSLNDRPMAEQGIDIPKQASKYTTKNREARSTSQGRSNHRTREVSKSPTRDNRGSQSGNNYDMSGFNAFLKDKRVNRDIRREMRVTTGYLKKDIKTLADRISTNSIDFDKAHTELSSNIERLTVQTERSEKMYKEAVDSYAENHNALVKEIQTCREEIRKNDLKNKEQLSLLNKVCGAADSKVNSLSLQFDTLHKEIQQLNRQSLDRTRDLETNFYKEMQQLNRQSVDRTREIEVNLHRLENKLIDNREQNNSEFAKLQKFIHDSLSEAKKKCTLELPSQYFANRPNAKPEPRAVTPKQEVPGQYEESVATQNSHDEDRSGAEEFEHGQHGEFIENNRQQHYQAGFHPANRPIARNNNLFGDRRPEVHRYAPQRGQNRNNEDLLKNLPRLAKYSGEVPWTDFINQFDKMARLSRWDFAIEMDMLHLHLTGAALHYFENLPPDVKIDPYRVREAMAERFGPDLPAEAQRSAFNSLERKDKESLRDFADRVRETAIQAYPNLRANYDESFMVPAFLRGLGYPDACMYNMNQNHRTLDTALRGVQLYLENEKAIYGRRSKSTTRINRANQELSWDPEIDSHVNALQRSRSPSNRPKDSNQKTPENGQTSNLRLFTEALNQFKELFGEFKEIRAQEKKERKEAATAAAQSKPSSTRNSPGNSPGKFVCYTCKQPGHIARDCPKAIENSLKDNVTA